MRVATKTCGLGLAAALSGFALALSACGGTAHNAPMQQAGSAGSAGSSGAAGAQDGGGTDAGGTNGGTNSAGTGGSLGGTTAEAGEPAGGEGPAPLLAPIPGGIRRLSAAEYGYTVEDVLGTKLVPSLDDFTTRAFGYDNNADANTVTEPLYERYLTTAEQLADEVFATPNLKQAYLLACATPDDEACVRGMTGSIGSTLFRQPLVAGEVDAYVGVYKSARALGDSHEDSLKLILTALLASAEFVMRIEYPKNPAGPQPISPYELATRLSYLLWSSAPDATLFQAAADDKLGTDAELDAQVERMLADPRAARFNKSFGGQWLEAWKVAQLTRDAQTFPQWNPTLAASAENEMYSFFGELVAKDRDISELLKSQVHYVDAGLATLYGIPSPGGNTTRVEIAGVDRQGFLGLAGFLAATSYEARTSPTLRGLFIQNRLLCQPIPPPPPNIPMYGGTQAGIRPYLESLDPACKACHQLIDPQGFTLEQYDAIGQFRTVYPGAGPIDASASLSFNGAPGQMVTGATGLSNALADSPTARQCVVQQLYTYGMGQAVAQTEPNVLALSNYWQSGATTLRDLIHDLVRSPTFTQRSDGGAP